MNPEEIEIKLDLINRDNYRKLIDYLGDCQSEFLQENIFIDTLDDDLRKSGNAVRIRKENDTVTVTVKGESDRSQEGVTIRPEINIESNDRIYKAVKNDGLFVSDLPDEILNILDEIEGGKSLAIVVSFKNRRRQFSADTENGRLLLEIDATEYPDGTIDYELEAELADRAEVDAAMKFVSGLLMGLDIPVIPQKESKIARALRRRYPAGCD